jgi:hypothetical protein
VVTENNDVWQARSIKKRGATALRVVAWDLWGKMENVSEYPSLAAIRDQRTRGACDATHDPVAATNADAFSNVDLLLDFAETAGRLRVTLTALRGPEDIFDAFLLAAALHQVAEDHLHRDLHSLGKVADHIPGMLGHRVGRPAAGVVRGIHSSGLALRARRPSERVVIRWARDHAVLVQRLAAAVAGVASGQRFSALALSSTDGLPRELVRTVARLPHCFRSFDQRPEDLARIVEGFALRHPDRTKSLLVVGLRTAGSYLAPLTAAFLAANGYADIRLHTSRPGRQWLEHELALIDSARNHRSLVLVVDEPPRAGSQLALAARELVSLGISKDSLVLFVPVFGSAVPPALESYETVPLAWDDWTVHERFDPDAVKADLSALLPQHRVERAERVHPSTLPASPRRGHTIGVFRVELSDLQSGARREEYVAAEGVGLGYLGRHASEVAAKLAEFVPKVHGLRDGLLYRAWLPEEWRQAGGDDRQLGDRIAAYVAARNRALAVSEDRTDRLAGRDSAADLVAAMLGEAFGKGRLPLRGVLRRTSRRLLATDRPSVIDGSMTLSHWFARPGAAAAARKVDFHARAFSNEDRASYDPVYDLACAAASDAGAKLEERLISAYERLSGAAVAPERWLLYQLLHHYWTERPKALAGGDVDRFLKSERAMALAHQKYLARQFFADLPLPESGPLCAIDVDWVLEVRWLGFPALSPAGALALRMLARHGYRPVIATGRSLGEVEERCRNYRLAGGVAEYGAVVYDHTSGRSRTLLSARDDAALASLRDRLRAIPHLHVEPGRQHSIRAFRLDRAGRVGLDGSTIDAALGGVSSQVRAIRAQSQTDFVIAHVDKGRGLRALAEELDEARCALAVGDSVDDLPMLRLSRRAAAPANADAGLSALIASGEAITRLKHPYGAGLLEVVSEVVGHRKSGCQMCAPRARTAPGALLLAALGALDGGARQKARQAAVLSLRLAWPSSTRPQ